MQTTLRRNPSHENLFRPSAPQIVTAAPAPATAVAVPVRQAPRAAAMAVVTPAAAAAAAAPATAPLGMPASLNFPLGIQSAFVKAAQDFSMRFWICDNSGSMRTVDGSRTVDIAGGAAAQVQCTRWEELADSIRFHSRVAEALAAPTEFMLLNRPGGNTPLTVTCGQDTPAGAAAWRRYSHVEIDGLVQIERMCKSKPAGRTPLCAAIKRVLRHVRSIHDDLVRRGQKVSLTIASDGEATDGNVADVLRQIQHERLPIWVVVKLCTDDRSIRSYWNDIDAELEHFDLDVLGDLQEEAKEIKPHNPWLTYGCPFHRLREFGTTERVRDSLDEQKLSSFDMMHVLALVFGERATEDVPHPRDWKNFERSVKALISGSPGTLDPMKKFKRRPWVDLRKLKAAYGRNGGSGACVIS